MTKNAGILRWAVSEERHPTIGGLKIVTLECGHRVSRQQTGQRTTKRCLCFTCGEAVIKNGEASINA